MFQGTWITPPIAQQEVDGELRVKPPKGSDFWRSTFYTPAFVKDDGAACVVPVDDEATLEIDLTLDPKAQFDQGGGFVRVNEECWVKAGIEFVDGSTRLSVVVTNGESDWSTQPWESTSARLRIHKLHPPQGPAIMIEVLKAGWQLVRIAPLRTQKRTFGMGIYAAAPVGDDCTAVFRSINIDKKQAGVHDAALPEDHGAL